VPLHSIDSALTNRIKAYALQDLGVDLIGVANIERFASAPLKMSPQGIFPAARSVISMALTHPDACIELGGLRHPQEIGPYAIQYEMNLRLDEISYRMALFLEDQGYQSVPIVSSNIWRYRGYKDLKEHFAPDLSHRHAAVAAGLAEFGRSGLAITPEYGARQRYVTVITDAPLQPNPLLPPGSVCDNCMLCVKHCRSEALSRELDGWSVVRIEDREYRYLKKNLWRCAWGEHFGLDLDLAIPEVVTEEVILDAVRMYGLRGGEMGSCLRHCVSKARRYFQPEYTDAPRRIRQSPPDGPIPQSWFERVRTAAARYGVDFVVTAGSETVEAMGSSITEYLPDGTSAVTVGVYGTSTHNGRPAPDADGAVSYLLGQAAYDITRLLQGFGYSAIMRTEFPESFITDRLIGIPAGRTVMTATVLTSAQLPDTDLALPAVAPPNHLAPTELEHDLRRLLGALGADLVGVAPVSRFGPLAKSLAPVFGDREELIARDQAGKFERYDPEIRVRRRSISVPDDYVPGARSVLVIGLRLPEATVDTAARTPAEAVGPYAFAQFESVQLLRLLAWRAARLLEDRGFAATWTFNLMGTGAVVGTPRGEQPDAFCNRFAAVAAGLGRLTKCGFVVTPEYGARVRFVAIVTDAEIQPSDLLEDDVLTADCAECQRCVEACPVKAFGGLMTVPIDSMEERFLVIDRARCEWSKRYSLVAEEGNVYMGWTLTQTPPETITPEALGDALRMVPPIEKSRPCNLELCVLACPYTRAQADPRSCSAGRKHTTPWP
jgi:epoxyqueuosine reductase QueG